ncbi:hypothetical protein WN66_01434 [Saccharomyces cerevisiae]|nr:hypothetical protein WN66_01434 [Saccharomyces cerevisiae]
MLALISGKLSSNCEASLNSLVESIVSSMLLLCLFLTGPSFSSPLLAFGTLVGDTTCVCVEFRLDLINPTGVNSMFFKLPFGRCDASSMSVYQPFFALCGL